jgi:Flp pilus assembly protein TadG
MSLTNKPKRSVRVMLSGVRKVVGSVQGSQIAELAIGLPFLMVLLVGIFDFGQAFNTKQKINTAAREAARYAANQSTLDWSSGTGAPSILATRDLVDAYLLNANLDDCRILRAVPTFDSATVTWTFQRKGTCPAAMTLTIQRANTFPMGNGTTAIATKVTITYPFQWHFHNVIKVLFPGSNYPGPIFHITSDAVMPNLS